MTLPAWWLLPLAIPVLLLGEWLVRHIKFLAKAKLPPAIVGGLLVALVVLCWPHGANGPLKIETAVTAKAYTWLVLPEPVWRSAPAKPIYLPFSTMFFTCVGLNASASIVRRGSWGLLVLLLVSTVLGFLQNVVGIELARSLHQSPLLGVLCGSVTLMGGPSTALGFADMFDKAGFAAAGTVGAASAMFGIVAASLLAGYVGAQIVRWRKLADPTVSLAAALDDQRPAAASGFLSQIDRAVRFGWPVVLHLVVLLACMKAGAWVSYGIEKLGGKFPVYIGAMLVAIVVRNASDWVGRGSEQTRSLRSQRTEDAPRFAASGASALAPTDVNQNSLDIANKVVTAATQKNTDPINLDSSIDEVSAPRRIPRISTTIVNTIASISLGLFLAMAMASLNLRQLRETAGPMTIILLVETMLTLAFAVGVVYFVMGRDYDAAVTTTGFIGYALGITPNAMASMDTVEQAFGPAPQALLVVTLVGGFLIDLTNGLLITTQLNFLQGH